MKAVVFHGPGDVRLEERRKPVLKDETDAIVKVETAGLCGSELHMYRGHQETKPGHIMGHEFIGIVESVGSKVKTFKPGDKVVSVFAAVCQTCWFCQHGLGNRCSNSLAFGTQQLDGGQAEFVRVPFADGTLHQKPAGLDDSLLIMMCDIFPTGYYGAARATSFLSQPLLPDTTIGMRDLASAVFVVLGCGPVGLCALLTAKTQGAGTVFAVDAVDDRLQQASDMGGIPLKLGRDDVVQVVREATGGRGADAVVEVVGNKAALRSAFELVRVCGVISSLGFHHGEVPFTANEAYQKNVTVSFGRAAISSLFDEALQCLDKNREHVATIVSHEMPLDKACSGYEIFEKYQARKVVFKP